MKKLWSLGILLAGAAGLSAQMHKVAAPETVVRAVGVYEWTGDLAKPTASRLIPVTLYIDKNLEDAGLYLARPVPFALETGVIYELDQAGVPKGYLNMAFARHLQAATVAEAYDDGWFGYGGFKGLVAPKPQKKGPPARIGGAEGIGVDPDRPHFVNRQGKPIVPASTRSDEPRTDYADTTKTDKAKTADTAKAQDDSDRPHFSRKNETKDTTDSGATPAGDPDRPTMKRRSGSDTASTADAGTNSGTMPPDDPDRPTLKKTRPAKETKKKGKDSDATVVGIGSLNDDPDRPTLHRGVPAHLLTEADLPKLSGLPVDLQQMVAVSDAKNRPVHDFSRPWEDDEERTAILTKMKVMAQGLLASYGSAVAPAAPVAPAARPNRPNSKLRRPLKPLKAAVAVPLADEQLKGFLLSYGDVPTFVYQARTEGEGTSWRYVTIVAQLDAQHEPKMVLHAVTDAAHLNQTARMRLVDAVDVEASNRASLLFELRGQSSRQFGVYRVLGLQAQQIFSTGTMQ